MTLLEWAFLGVPGAYFLSDLGEKPLPYHNGTKPETKTFKHNIMKRIIHHPNENINHGFFTIRASITVEILLFYLHLETDGAVYV